MKKIGYTTGVFDLFHIGHLNIIKSARKNCDYLIVGVTSDEFCLELKGKKPVIPAEERIAIIRELRCVDKVVLQNRPMVIEDYKKIGFNIVFKGSDWENTEKWLNYEKEFKKVGVEVKYFPYTRGTSSTLIKEFLEKNINHQ